jgi:iron complex transport system ATP-binding protein
MPPLVEIDDVVVERNRVRILDLHNLTIAHNENVVIFGPNGSGKSTLLKLLMKFFYPSALEDRVGTIRIFGQENWNVWELRRHLGFVSSEIDHHFTVGRSGRLTPLEAVLTGYESSELELDPAQVDDTMRASATQWLEFFDISPRSKKHVAWLSTGERRRVMLARSMVRGATSLLLDEPTAGLDLLARERLLRKLEEMIARNIQIVLVTHHLEEVLPQMNRVIMLQSGRIMADGLARDLLCSNQLSALFGCQVEVVHSRGRYTASLL